MREIKYRAWDKDEKRMRDWIDLQQIRYGHNRIIDPKVEDNLFNDPDFILMQYTGLKDKNGKEVYEGDVISHKSEKEKDGWQQIGTLGYHPENALLVVWDEKIGQWRATGKTGYYLLCSALERNEKIGSIHENPELIGKP